MFGSTSSLIKEIKRKRKHEPTKWQKILNWMNNNPFILLYIVICILFFGIATLMITGIIDCDCGK